MKHHRLHALGFAVIGMMIALCLSGCNVTPTENADNVFVAMWCGPNLTFKDGQWVQWGPDSPEDVRYFIERCSQGGIDRIYPSLGDHYNSKLFKGRYQDAGWDPLEVLIEAAHEKGIEVHPYQPVFHHGPWFEKLPHPIDYYYSNDSEGSKDNRVSPGYPEIRSVMLDVFMELLTDYDVDGIMLDYIRFHNFYTGYDEPILEAYKAEYGIDPHKLSASNPRWLKFKAGYVTQFIRDLRARMADKGIEKPLSVSATCFGTGTTKEALFQVSQDLQTWADEGLIETFCPMAYTADLEELTMKVSNFTQNIKANNKNAKVLGAIAPYEDRLSTPSLLKAGAEAVMQSGADGVCIYRGDYMERYSLWDAANEISQMSIKQIKKGR